MLLASGRIVVMSEDKAPQDCAADDVKVLGRVLGVFFEIELPPAETSEAEGKDHG
jgi:hypothetical protein